MRLNKNVIKIICFGLIFIILFLNVQNVFQAKWSDDRDCYFRIKDFYQKEHQPEVVFMGSSHLFFTINPLVLFQEYGFTSHNFASPGQDFSLNLLYMKEALKAKNPEVIVLDVFGIIGDISEVNHRKGVDPLPMSSNKMDQILYIMEYSRIHNLDVEYDSIVSYLFPIVRYHTRWKELQSDDFLAPNILNYHGYTPHYETVVADFSKYGEDVSLGELYDEKKQLFDTIVSTCEESNIALVLIKSPSPRWRNGYHNIVTEWAKASNIPFIDYNLLMEDLDIHAETDFSDKTSHLNDQGATKVSLHLGKYLLENYDLPDHRGDPAYDSWNDDWTVYQQDKAAYFLSNETDWESYLQKLQDDNYTIYITVKDHIGGSSHPELVSKLAALGLTSELKDKGWWSYQAIIDAGEVIYENLQDDPLTYHATVNDHKITLISKDYVTGNMGSIQIDYEEYFVDKRGFGIVVYDNVLDKVVDSVTFDLHGGGTAYRD